MAAAFVKGIGSLNQGVITIRSEPFSSWPVAPSTIKPTQSIQRTFTRTESSTGISTAVFGINFGSDVIMTVPPLLCGSSSLACSRLCTSSILGMTIISINRLIKVDFPVRTGPTTPR